MDDGVMHIDVSEVPYLIKSLERQREEAMTRAAVMESRAQMFAARCAELERRLVPGPADQEGGTDTTEV